PRLAGRRVPANAGGEGREAETQCAQHRGEEQVLLEAPAAAAPGDELALERVEVEGDFLPDEGREILEGNRGRMQRVQALEGGQRGGRVAVEADAREVRVQVRRGGHQSPSSG